MRQILQQNPAAGINRAARADGADDLGSAYDPYGSVLHRLTGSREGAEDAVQEAFVRLARAGRIPCSGQVLARYLFPAARNAAISALRRRRRDRTVPLGISANTAASRYRYAMARLRLQLEDERNG